MNQEEAQQLVAWATVWPDDGDGVDCNWIYSNREDAEWAAAGGDHIDGRRGVGTVIPLYRQPQLTLTDAERDAISYYIDGVGGPAARVATLRGLLERLEGG